MKQLFTCTYPLTPHSNANFSVTESEDGALGIATDGMWIRIPYQAWQALHDILLDQIEAHGGCPSCATNEADADRQGEIAEALDKPEPTKAQDDWHCGNRKLQAQFAVAMLAAGKASANDAVDLEYLAQQSGPAFTRAAIGRLLPGMPIDDLQDDDLPF